MKLELKHLSAYFPYSLRFIHNNEGVDIVTNINLKITNRRLSKTNDVKLLLRPLSDLTKEIEVNGEKFFPIERLRSEFSNIYFEIGILNSLVIKGKNENFIIYSSTILINEKLCEWHFDISGLIDAGLAVDINTVKF